MKVRDLIRALQATRYQDADVLIEGCDCIGEVKGALERRGFNREPVILITRAPEAGSVAIGSEAITDKDLAPAPTTPEAQAEKTAGF